jgi:hypothetical protein
MGRVNAPLIAAAFALAASMPGATHQPGAGDAPQGPSPVAPLGGPLQVLQEPYRLGSFTSMAQIMPARPVPRGGPVFELPRDPRDLSGVRYSHAGSHATLADYLARRNVMGLVVLKDGRIVHETYRLGTRASTPFTSWSVAKSVTSTLVGVALAQGHLKRLDDPLTRYAPELAASAYGANTLEDLLQMTSGVRFIEDYGGGDTPEARAWIDGIVDRRVRYSDTFLWFKERLHPPGTRFYYASLEPAILGWIVTRATGHTLADYFSETIWQHLGAEHDASWLLDRPGGLEIASCCLNASLRDYARFGLLVLNEGRVGTRQVVPADWIRLATRPDPAKPFLHPGRIEARPGFGYQHYWWLWPDSDRTVMARGVFGQAITIDFDDRVVIVQAANWDRTDDQEYWLELAELQRAIVRALR